jgi:hypothetical protein
MKIEETIMHVTFKYKFQARSTESRKQDGPAVWNKKQSWSCEDETQCLENSRAKAKQQQQQQQQQ